MQIFHDGLIQFSENEKKLSATAFSKRVQTQVTSNLLFYTYFELFHIFLNILSKKNNMSIFYSLELIFNTILFLYHLFFNPNQS